MRAHLTTEATCDSFAIVQCLYIDYSCFCACSFIKCEISYIIFLARGIIH